MARFGRSNYEIVKMPALQRVGFLEKHTVSEAQKALKKFRKKHPDKHKYELRRIG